MDNKMNQLEREIDVLVKEIKMYEVLKVIERLEKDSFIPKPTYRLMY
jgi:hypothetical protein